MLVLTRREFETIKLYTSDGEIEITITKIEGKQVRVGIAAPDDVDIERGELEY